MSPRAVVVGGGPAGCVAATLLARAGWSVTLHERAQAGRDKPCGHCLSPRAVARLAALGLDDAVEGATVGRTSCVSIRAADSKPLVIDIDGPVVVRRIFDRLLAERAERTGVRMCFESRVGAEHDAELVVGADGLGSRVARAVGWSDPRPGRSFGFAGDIDTIDGHASAERAIVMHVRPNGYLGTVRRDDGRVHVGGLVRHSAGAARTPASFVRETVAVEGDAWTAIGPMPWRPHQRAAAGVALVGDAAGYVEPFTGEGIGWAIESAMLLAHAARDLRFGGEEAVAYDRAWRRSIGRAQRRCACIAIATRRPRLMRLAGAIPGVTKFFERALGARS